MKQETPAVRPGISPIHGGEEVNDKLTELLGKHELRYSFRRENPDSPGEESVGCSCDWEGPWLPDRGDEWFEPDITAWHAHMAEVIREAFKPAAYVIGWYNQPPMLDDIAVFPYGNAEDAASDAARNSDGIEWRVFALHEVPEGEAE